MKPTSSNSLPDSGGGHKRALEYAQARREALRRRTTSLGILLMAGTGLVALTAGIHYGWALALLCASAGAVSFAARHHARIVRAYGRVVTDDRGRQKVLWDIPDQIASGGM